MPSAPRLDLQLVRSRWRLRLLAAGFLLSVAAVAATRPGWVAGLTALVLLSAAVVRCWRAPWPNRIRYDEAGWLVRFSDCTETHGTGLEHASSGVFVSSITLCGPRRHPVALFTDCFSGADHKRLRRLLRRGNNRPP